MLEVARGFLLKWQSYTKSVSCGNWDVHNMIVNGGTIFCLIFVIGSPILEILVSWYIPTQNHIHERLNIAILGPVSEQ